MWVYIKYGNDDENYLLSANSRGSKYWRSQKEPITKKGHRPHKNTKMHKYQSAGTDFFLRYSLAQGMQLMLFKAPSWNSSSTCRSGLMSTNVLVYKMNMTLAWYSESLLCRQFEYKMVKIKERIWTKIYFDEISHILCVWPALAKTQSEEGKQKLLKFVCSNHHQSLRFTFNAKRKRYWWFLILLKVSSSHFFAAAVAQ